MSHFAEINDNNEVIRVIVADSLEWCQSRLSGRWIQTSYNATIRKNYAGIGYKFDAELDAFVPPQPTFNSSLDRSTARWEFPTGTDVIYVPIASKAAVPLSQALFSLIYPDEDGMYCGVIPHPERAEVATLQLRTTDIIPIALGSDPSPLGEILKPFVAAGSLTEEELKGIVFGVQAMAGQTITIKQFIPESWQPFVMDRAAAIELGWIEE